MAEIWKDIKGYEGLYQISNEGRVKSLKRWDVNKKTMIDANIIMHPTDNGKGYKIVSLRKNTKRKNHYVHRLVAEAFIPKNGDKNHVNHLDYDRGNNAVENLEWCTQKENIHYSIPRMMHRKTFSHTNTGEKYIYYRKSRDRFRVVVNNKEYATYKTLDEAIKKRNEILEVI